MELRQLEAFIAVAEERNFTRAAGRLYIAQSGLSATIRTLEHELGTELFIRTTRRVDLSAAGLALLPEARRTLAAADSAVEAVHGVEGLQRGAVSVGFMQGSELFNFTDLLAKYRSAYPAIDIRLRQASSADLVTMLGDGTLDVIFTTTAEEPPSDVLSAPMLESPLVLIDQGNDNPAVRGSVRLATVAQRRLIGFPVGWGIRDLADRAMASVGVQPRVDVEVNDTTMLLDLVAAGLGSAVVPAAVAQLRGAVRATPIAGEPWHWIVAAQTTSPRARNPAGRALWELITSKNADAKDRGKHTAH